MTKDKSLHLTPKQLGLKDNPMIKDADPLASDSGETEVDYPSQSELIDAILAAWKINEGGQGIPHTAWAIYAAHAVEKLMGWNPR